MTSNWIAIGAAIALAAWGVAKMAERTRTASAPYQVVNADGNFEVRDYPNLTLVETAMETGDKTNVNSGFRRLFNFISGLNQASRKIAMTTPVFISEKPGGRTMAFVMPAEMKQGDVPAPSDPALRVRVVKSGRFAVLRFRGLRNERNEKAATEALRERMRAEGLEGDAAPVFGYFDPPWTPGFMRRNEAMIQLKAPGAQP